MLLLAQHEELLRADLLIAENSLDATRQAIADNEVADEEGKLILAARAEPICYGPSTILQTGA